jgi:hypothetical protein
VNANRSSCVFFLPSGRNNAGAGAYLGRWLLWAAVLCIAWGGHIGPVQATKRDGPPSSATASKPPKTSVRVRTQRSSSEESPKAREQRLRRECRGRPDAGACLGYTRR